jgi:hypothetical protein
MAFLHQLHDVAGHGRAADAQLVGQLLLWNQRVLPQPLQDFLFAFGH